MPVQHLFQPFEIEFIRLDQCPIKYHQNTFFELVFILDGAGIYHINENQFAYSAENLFLLKPLDNQYTEVQVTTTFLFVRFHNIYLEAQRATEPHGSMGEWIKKLEYIFQNGNPLQGSIIRNNYDKPLINALAKAIIQESTNQFAWHKELLQQLVNTLIMVVARNIAQHQAERTNLPHHHTLDIIHYIHLNIYQPEELKARHIASHFNISLHYISEYFKKHTGQNLQQYIINYKLSLIEIRLKHSNMRLNEIAYEFGFTDESHLTKTFKKYRGLKPTDFRKAAAVAITA